MLQDTEELQYSMDLSEENESSCTTSSDEELPSLNTLKPYDFEPS